MKNHLRAGLVFLFLIPAAIALAGHGHGGGSHGGHSHGGGSHGGHFHGGAPHGGRGFGWHGGRGCGPGIHHWNHSSWWWPSFYAGSYPYGYGAYYDPEYDGDYELDYEGEEVRDAARLLLSVRPGDAVVYLDDEFLGTAEEISGEGPGIPLAAGGHTVEVARPGFQTQGLDFEVADGEDKSVAVDLEK